MKEILKYLDNFGTKIHFYTDKNKKYYTVLGGIFTIVSLFFCIITFAFLVLEDIKCPKFVYISNISRKNKNIKLNEEKIFIPWHFIDENNDFFNHSGLICPVITYYYTEKKNTEKLKLKNKTINYELCDKTSMANLPDIYSIEKPLNELYCMNTHELEIKDSNTEILDDYLTIDFYFCENGIGYKTQNCSNLLSNDINFNIEIFYPEIHFDPINYNNPISIIYSSHLDYLNKFSTKINKIYMQENILVDDIRWLGKSSKISSYWNTKKLLCDTFQFFDSPSKLHSVEIYFKSSIKQISRKYKKIYSIISDGLPIVYALYMVCEKISKLFKMSEENRRLVELLFENLVEKKNKFKEKLNIRKIKDIDNDNNIKIFKQTHNLSEFNKCYSKLNPSFSKFQKNISKNTNYNPNVNSKKPQNKQSISLISSPSIFNNNNNSKSFLLNSAKNSHLFLMSSSHTPIKKAPLTTYSVNQSQAKQNIYRKSKPIYYSDFSCNAKRLVPTKLFPYRYYFFMLFIKNLDSTKRTFCFPKKFVKANLFLRQLLDISSYLLLQREFHVLKSQFLTTDEINLVENSNKININNHTFSRVMNDCIENQKFYIFTNNIVK